jgi:hypothetical protein
MAPIPRPAPVTTDDVTTSAHLRQVVLDFFSAFWMFSTELAYESRRNPRSFSPNDGERDVPASSRRPSSSFDCFPSP